MSCGNEFVKTLRKIKYPRAETLSGEDFDWLFEREEEAAFLRWFCGAVREAHVVAPDELQAFAELQESGRPVLDGAALEEALRTCRPSAWSTPALEEEELEKLEEELQTLQKLKNLKIQRRNKYQLMASVASHRLPRLQAKEEEATKKLKQSQRVLSAVNAKVSSELEALNELVAKLMTVLRNSGFDQGTDPPVFMSQLSLEKYLSQEEQSTAALTLYTKKHFFQGMLELVERSNEENFQLLDIQTPSTCDSQKVLEERRLEMARLQLAYICVQHQLIHLKANNLTMKSRIKWLEENLHGLADKAIDKDNLDAKISSLSSEILKLEEEVTHMKEKSLPVLIRENAQLLNMPVVKGDFDLQIEKQDYYTTRQKLVLNHLIKQKASFELLQLSYELELRKHWDICHQLEGLAQELSKSNVMLQQHLEMLTDPSVSQQMNPRNTIDTKDYSTQRLYQLLGETEKKELFITHENFEKAAEKFKMNASLIQNQFAISAQEHSFFLSKLNKDVDMLCDVLYQGGNQLLLSDRELMEQFHQVESQMNKLNHLFTDILADVKTKRKILASDKLHQTERKLYVYFLKDQDYLKEIVENLENQSKIKADFMKMENYETVVNFGVCKIPLSSVAQKIMSALRSGDLVESKNWRESEKNAEVMNNPSVKYSVSEDEKNQSVEQKKQNFNALTSQASNASIKCSPQLSNDKLRDQLSTDPKLKNISSLAPSGHLLPLCNSQETFIIQKMDHRREHFLKENMNNMKKESMNLKRKQAPGGVLSESTGKQRALERDAEDVEAHLKSENSRAFKKHIHDIRHLDDSEKRQLIEMIKQAAPVVATLMYKDGSTQLGAGQALISSVKGIVMSLQSPAEGSWPLVALASGPGAPAAGCKPQAGEWDFYVKTERFCPWNQEQEAHNQFARDLLLQMLKCQCPVICLNAKDFLKTVLRFLGDDGSGKHVANFVGLDPRIAAWLLDPSDTAPSFEDLVVKYFENSVTVNVNSTYGNSSRKTVNQNISANLRVLRSLTMRLCAQLKADGLWQLFCTLELPLIPVLAVMESHSIRVNRDELERTSVLLGSRLKELEREAHFAAGEQFLVTSSLQLREILFGKLQLHLLCPRESLPRTGLQRQLSTSEASLRILQDLHPLPGVILEHRQVHKIKSTFVDGLLSCMKEGSVVSSTWNQTGTVTGRLSANHPNIQGISKVPIRITKPQNVKGKEDNISTITPRAMFIASAGRTFLAADFSQIELRILTHLSGDPELLKLFQESEQEDVFSALASQWKVIPVEHVTPSDREQTKKVVYSAVYGAGKERLAACLGIPLQEAAQFLESFLQKYKKIKEFSQATIAQCQRSGYVVTLMGRRRPLPQIWAQDAQLRAQAERQAVNFVVQGSAADLCKMAMIRIFTAVASSPSLSARLVAQIHDELLFEVEEPQVPTFAALVRRSMESLRNMPASELRLQVPLKVSLSTGHSWGHLTPLQGACSPPPTPMGALP